ncbi:uncharacterized protein LOC121374456 [Gigantopelta aegis]|uniref:uncharacterized protein LOC121374456 n=1 Tax=Gigantopelta aegis TaxID=1735272 RepID=UPI001B888954|nr:uncharacterized protein LOC121374456 [Gigantopelta aegis]
MKSIPTEERAKEVKTLNLECEKLPSERALGVFWFVESDSLGFKICERIQRNTRREILSVISSVYDPLGFAAPFILTAKQLLQSLCKRDIGWDDEIDCVSLKLWQKWQEDLPNLVKIQIQRCYKPKNFGRVVLCQLHMFTDASDCGYGVVAYLRLMNVDNDVHCALIMAKSRVAPLKKITIPRMELTAATVGVRLCKVITDELQYNIDETFFWTDSMSVLRYIANNTSRFQTFVANRVALIREGTQVRQWRYINSKCNPADCASRGMSFDKFLQHKQWFEGPTFLWKPQKDWPQEIDIPCTIPNDDPEVKKSVNCVLTNGTNIIDKVINYYSSWSKLKRAVGWIILIMNRLHQKAVERKQLYTELKMTETNPVLRCNLVQKKLETTKIPDDVSCENVLTTDTLEKAEMALIQHVQAQHFHKELRAMTDKESKKDLNKGVGENSPLYKLDPFLSDGVIRVGGRLERAQIQYDMKHPVVLPKNCVVSKLILEEIHRLVGHMLSLLRQRHWILGARTSIKGIVSKCVICRKYKAPPGEQKMADLPEERLKPDLPPFSHVGMDYFGPFQVKRGRSCVKRYGVIFTCLNIRAVHLEVASSLDTDSCINAIRRFIARRGSPKLIRSDNGTNLVGSEREFREELSNLNQTKLHSSLLKKGIDWYFNTPAASHHGGVWERMIRSVRKILYSIMQEQTVKLDDECLYTLLCEVEAILNGRPITDVPCDPHDLSPLTPNHLFLLRSGDKMPPGVFNKADTYCRRWWRQVQYLADVFWKRWIREYLPLLQDRQKWLTRKRNLAVGDIVLVMDSSPRNAWSLGRITEVVIDKKGLVRTVKLKTASSELVRPIDKLCVIVSQ